MRKGATMQSRVSFWLAIGGVAILAAVVAVILTLAVVDRRPDAPVSAPAPAAMPPSNAVIPSPTPWGKAFVDMMTQQAEQAEARREREQDYELCELKRQSGEVLICTRPFP
jgi:hypothetical protein